MTRQDVRTLLLDMRDLIQKERQCALTLDIEGLDQTRRKKESILRILENIDTLAPEDASIAREISEENRRNAFLFRATLNWIQDTMIFFGRKTVPATYGKSATTCHCPVNGRLLSGRI